MIERALLLEEGPTIRLESVALPEFAASPLELAAVGLKLSAA
ncbi:MAG: hypothetical protein WHX52_21855 [Anaerolineae bacterium]